MASADPSQPNFVYQDLSDNSLPPGLRATLDEFERVQDLVAGKGIVERNQYLLGRDFRGPEFTEPGVTPMSKMAQAMPNRQARYGRNSPNYVFPLGSNAGLAGPAQGYVNFANDEYSEAPTATSDPTRPRTVAAFYEPDIDDVEDVGILTVVFRDNTVYNYYDVSRDEWDSFRNSSSKGGTSGPIESFLNSKSRGPADVSELSPEHREIYYRNVRNTQFAVGGRNIRPNNSKYTKKGTPRKRASGELAQVKKANVVKDKAFKKMIKNSKGK